MTYEEIEANYPEEFALRNGAFLFPLSSIYGRRIYGQLDSPTAHTFVLNSYRKQVGLPVPARGILLGRHIPPRPAGTGAGELPGTGVDRRAPRGTSFDIRLLHRHGQNRGVQRVHPPQHGTSSSLFVFVFAFVFPYVRAIGLTTRFFLFNSQVIKLTPKTHECDEDREVLYVPTKADLGAIVEGDERGGGVSPTAADGVSGVRKINPFAANPEPPSY